MSELHVQTRLDMRYGWVFIPLELQGDEQVELVLDTGTFHSAISANTRDDLDALGLLEPLGRNRWLLRGVSMAGQPIADLPVRLSTRAGAVGAPGMLGLDFLGRYEEVRFHFPTMGLTLVEA